MNISYAFSLSLCAFSISNNGVGIAAVETLHKSPASNANVSAVDFKHLKQ